LILFLIEKIMRPRLKNIPTLTSAFVIIVSLVVGTFFFKNLLIDLPPGINESEYKIIFEAINSTENKNGAENVEILEIKVIDRVTRILSSSNCIGDWEIQNNNSFNSLPERGGELICSFIARPGSNINILFSKGPSRGIVRINLNGKFINEQIEMNLYSPQANETIVQSHVPFSIIQTVVKIIDLIAYNATFISLTALICLEHSRSTAYFLKKSRAFLKYLSFAFSITLIVLIVSNFILIPNVRPLYRLEPHSRNSFNQFANIGKRSSAVHISIAFFSYLQNSIIVISPDIIQKIKLDTEELKNLLDLKAVEIYSYSSNISEQEVQRIKKYGFEEWEHEGYGDYLLVTEQKDENKKYIILNHDNEYFLMPTYLMP